MMLHDTAGHFSSARPGSEPHEQAAIAYIKRQANGLRPRLGLIMGSGLSEWADALHVHARLPYTHIPHFPACHVPGHPGTLLLGQYKETPLACFEGRHHLYEPGIQPATFLQQMAVLSGLGCTHLLISNASGALNPNLSLGDVVLISDHINHQGVSPLAHLSHSRFTACPPFVGMENAYDTAWRDHIRHTLCPRVHAAACQEAVYIGVHGPQFETPAEIGAFRTWGADIVGMSSVLEVIAARYFNLTVAAISVITNQAAGLSAHALSHAVSLAGAKSAAPVFNPLLLQCIEDLP